LQGILMFLLTASNIWLLYRDIAKKAGIPLLVDEATMAFILELLGKLKPPAN
jgi:hypothetical protein